MRRTAFSWTRELVAAPVGYETCVGGHHGQCDRISGDGSEHHRLAGMCRSPESREQHLRLEKELLVLADNEECLHKARVPQHASHPQLVK
jgi:hypothetical protein